MTDYPIDAEGAYNKKVHEAAVLSDSHNYRLSFSFTSKEMVLNYSLHTCHLNLKLLHETFIIVNKIIMGQVYNSNRLDIREHVM